MAVAAETEGQLRMAFCCGESDEDKETREPDVAGGTGRVPAVQEGAGAREITVKGHRDVMTLFFKRHPDWWPDKVKEAIYRFMGENIKPATFNIPRVACLSAISPSISGPETTPCTCPRGLLLDWHDGPLVALSVYAYHEVAILPAIGAMPGSYDPSLRCLRVVGVW
jgi:hypothetical protein